MLGLEILFIFFALQHGRRVKRRRATTRLDGTLLSGISGHDMPQWQKKKPGLQAVAGRAREWSSGPSEPRRRKRDVAGVRRRHVQPSHSGLGGSGQPDVGAPNVLANTTERACRALRLRHSAIHSAAAAAYLRPLLPHHGRRALFHALVPGVLVVTPCAQERTY